MHLSLTVFATSLALLVATCTPLSAATEQQPVDHLIGLLSEKSVALVGSNGVEFGVRRRGAVNTERISESEIVQRLTGIKLSAQQAGSLWGFFADTDNAGFLTLPIIKALVVASGSTAGHDAMWSELAGLTEGDKQARPSGSTILSFFAKHRQALLPLLSGIKQTEGAGNAMADLLTTSRVFGDEVEDGVRWLGVHNPAALARRIERERGHGRPVKWEHSGFDQILKWKERHFGPKASEAPRTPALQEADAETFIVLFNCLHDFDEWYRRQMLTGLTPFDAFAVVAGGEAELYRLGTSGYRNYLHPLVMRGIAESGSFEAFVDRAARTPISVSPAELAQRRMVFLRVVSAFGLMESVLATVKDRTRFIADTVNSLANLQTLESNASVTVDIVTSRAKDAASSKFRRELIDHLYERHAAEEDLKQRSIFGSVLSVYQSLTGDLRDPEVGRLYPLDRSLTRTSFDSLFSPNGGGHVHRIFMRFDDDVDASSSYTGFRALMFARGAAVHTADHFEAYRISKNNRSIEVYVNRPNTAGLKKGLIELGRLLDGKVIHTVIGRGHTGIITPLRNDTVRLLGPRTAQVATVILGTCGGSASTRDLIDTFGYRTFISTRATGRQIINNAIVDKYLTMLLALAPGEHLAIADVLGNAIGPILTSNGDEELRQDAQFYHVNAANVYAAMLFDRHVRGKAVAETVPTPTAGGTEPAALSWRQLTSRDDAKPSRPERARMSGMRKETEKLDDGGRGDQSQMSLR